MGFFGNIGAPSRSIGDLEKYIKNKEWKNMDNNSDSDAPEGWWYSGGFPFMGECSDWNIIHRPNSTWIKGYVVFEGNRYEFEKIIKDITPLYLSMCENLPVSIRLDIEVVLDPILARKNIRIDCVATIHHPAPVNEYKTGYKKETIRLFREHKKLKPTRTYDEYTNPESNENSWIKQQHKYAERNYRHR